MEPTTGVSIGAIIMDWGTWAAGAIGLTTAVKIIVDYAYVKRDVKAVEKKVDKVDQKLDKLLECSQSNAKQIAVLNERTKDK